MKKRTIKKPLAELGKLVAHNKVTLDRLKIKKNSWFVKNLVAALKKIPEYRMVNKSKYPLHEILLIIFLGVLAGHSNYTVIADFAEDEKKWLSIFSPFENGVPSHDCIRRTALAIDSIELQTTLVQLMKDVVERLMKFHSNGDDKDLPKVINIDGKTGRSTGRKKTRKGPVKDIHLLHVYDTSIDACILSMNVGEKTNEIPKTQEALPLIDLENAIVTCDALNTQKKTIETIIAGGGDYVCALKKNQQLFHEDLEEFFDDERISSIKKDKINYYVTTDKANSKTVIREYYFSNDVEWFEEKEKWANLKGFICRKTITIENDERKVEPYYFITTLDDVELCATVLRTHWSVENNLHWHLDVTFGDDRDANMYLNAYMNMSLFRKVSLFLINIAKFFHRISLRRILNKIARNAIGYCGALLSLFDTKNLLWLQEELKCST